MQLVVATRNKHKLRELRALLSDLDFEVVSVSDLPNVPEVVEDQPTLRDNAIKKAVETARATGRLTLADDSGLEVDALGGAPGVMSAHYAGENASYHENNKKLLAALAGVPLEKRTARFRCVVAIADANGLVDTVEGVCNGLILTEERGGNGFGYDPLFLPDGQVKTFGELPAEIKNRISHRAKALQKAWAVLSRYARTRATQTTPTGRAG
ncbi:MAG: XTP/dITP diphosphatase [Verrucomicrobiae bacterium]|nr:XTP/dITP diphosphatase [Verrucomicrobiae bacterium]MDW8343133.1 XTP/dITP diphosphatase [Verrucomicrobiae bacterium]